MNKPTIDATVSRETSRPARAILDEEITSERMPACAFGEFWWNDQRELLEGKRWHRASILEEW